MRPTRKFNTVTKIYFVVFAALLLAMFGAMAVSARTTVSHQGAGYSLSSGSVVYDNTFTPIQLADGGTVRAGADGQYTLGVEGGVSLPLGAHTMAYTGGGAVIFGGGYRVDVTGEVTSVTDGEEMTGETPCLYKLADRRYLITYSEITDMDQIFTAEDYLYIVMDVVGNARMYSSNLSLKTTQPTTIVAGDLTFDIANELLTVGGQTIDMARVIGSTNTYDSGTYKTIEEEQTPDSIDITIRGGNGGNGGTGGEGGAGGAGGTGGTGGSGGSGGTGGTGGSGGVGGTGGTGGAGGAGGIGESQDVVQVVTLKGAQAKSGSIQVDYYFVDPFGTLGMVYLEVHKASDLKALGITVSDLYDDETTKPTEVGTYWENFDAAFRTSINAYDGSYTFNNGITPETEYYVVLAHVAENEDGEVEKVLDDYYRLVTPKRQNLLAISYVNTGAIGVNMVLDSLEGEPVRLVTDFTAPSGGSALQISYTLTSEDLAAAAAGGVEIELPITSEDELRAFKGTQVLQVKLLDGNGQVLLKAFCANSFYTGG